jgi:hypothetical protein
VFAQGALASYILGQFVVDQTAQDADLNETTFYTNFKNALVSYIKANAVSLDTAQTVGGVKTFTSSPIVPTADAADNSQKVATTAFVQGEIVSKANASEVVKLTGNQTIAGVKTFSDSPEVPTAMAGDNSQKIASTGFVQNAVSSQAVVKLTGDQSIDGVKDFIGSLLSGGKTVEAVNSYSKTGDMSGWIRFESGLQICWGRTTINMQNAESSGWSGTYWQYRKINQAWTFPVPFSLNPACYAQADYSLNYGAASVYNTSTTQAIFNAVFDRNDNTDLPMHLCAIGFWK